MPASANHNRLSPLDTRVMVDQVMHAREYSEELRAYRERTTGRGHVAPMDVSSFPPELRRFLVHAGIRSGRFQELLEFAASNHVRIKVVDDGALKEGTAAQYRASNRTVEIPRSALDGDIGTLAVNLAHEMTHAVLDVSGINDAARGARDVSNDEWSLVGETVAEQSAGLVALAFDQHDARGVTKINGKHHRVALPKELFAKVVDNEHWAKHYGITRAEADRMRSPESMDRISKVIASVSNAVADGVSNIDIGKLPHERRRDREDSLAWMRWNLEQGTVIANYGVRRPGDDAAVG